jgi:hypothetical protein
MSFSECSMAYSASESVEFFPCTNSIRHKATGQLSESKGSLEWVPHKTLDTTEFLCRVLWTDKRVFKRNVVHALHNFYVGNGNGESTRYSSRPNPAQRKYARLCRTGGDSSWAVSNTGPFHWSAVSRFPWKRFYDCWRKCLWRSNCLASTFSRWPTWIFVETHEGKSVSHERRELVMI